MGAAKQVATDLERTIRGMESRLADRSGPSGGTGGSGGAMSCCEPTRECLVAAVGAPAADRAPEVVITTEEQAQAWLRGDAPEIAPPPGPQITFLDELERIAVVTWPGSDRSERWEHLFGYWRRVDGR